MAASLPMLIDALEHTWESTAALAESLDTDEWSNTTGCPGWTVFDNVAHIVGLERALMGDPEPDVTIPDGLPHIKNDVGRYMETHIEARRGTPPSELVAELRAMAKERIDYLRSLPDSMFDEEVPGPMGFPVKLGAFLNTRLFDSWAHEQDIRRAVGRPGNLRSPEARLTLERTAKGLARKLAEARPVRIAVTGEQDLTFEVGGGEPVADITVPFDVYIPLVCGRDDADLSQVKIDGDEAAAQAVIAALGITP
ncbi:MAG: hypothetical protein QOG03_988 [Actinomycetota bacterium]|jgi:uncharacterized protein (TIGR03083 family)|nr:hypothetical protein [Actinomycetota bacterium]